jgi:uncharacterized phage-associated protein
LKLQKLCYYAQGMSLALRGRPLWSDYRIKAWDNGPVVPDVYHAYKGHGWQAIPRLRNLDESRYDAEARQILDMVYESFGRLSATRLSQMTHAEQPWLDAHERATQTKGDDAITEASLSAFFANPSGAAAEVMSRAMWDHMRRTHKGWDAEAQRGHKEIAAGRGVSLAELRSQRGL